MVGVQAVLDLLDACRGDFEDDVVRAVQVDVDGVPAAVAMQPAAQVDLPAGVVAFRGQRLPHRPAGLLGRQQAGLALDQGVERPVVADLEDMVLPEQIDFVFQVAEKSTAAAEMVVDHLGDGVGVGVALVLQPFQVNRDPLAQRPTLFQLLLDRLAVEAELLELFGEDLLLDARFLGDALKDPELLEVGDSLLESFREPGLPDLPGEIIDGFLAESADRLAAFPGRGLLDELIRVLAALGIDEDLDVDPGQAVADLADVAKALDVGLGRIGIVVHPQVQLLLLAVAGEPLELLLGDLTDHAENLVDAGIDDREGVVLPFHQYQLVIAVQGFLVVEPPFPVAVVGGELVRRPLLQRVLDGEMEGFAVFQVGKDHQAGGEVVVQPARLLLVFADQATTEHLFGCVTRLAQVAEEIAVGPADLHRRQGGHRMASLIDEIFLGAVALHVLVIVVHGIEEDLVAFVEAGLFGRGKGVADQFGTFLQRAPFVEVVVLEEEVEEIAVLVALEAFVELVFPGDAEAVVPGAKRAFRQMVPAHLDAGFRRDDCLEVRSSFDFLEVVHGSLPCPVSIFPVSGGLHTHAHQNRSDTPGGSPLPI